MLDVLDLKGPEKVSKWILIWDCAALKGLIQNIKQNTGAGFAAQCSSV